MSSMPPPRAGEQARAEGRRPTDEQRAAIEAPHATVFVSAGAGSGKTSLLVERYLRAVLDERMPMRNVPTVTFTRKAAGEMRRRIRERLLDRGQGALAWELDGAPIGTIHGLCARLLRTHALDAAVDPHFAVLEEDRADILLEEAYAAAWDQRLVAADDREVAVLARHGAVLKGGVLGLYNRLRQQGEAVPRLSLPPPPDPTRPLADLREAVDAVLRAAPDFTPVSTAAKNAVLLAEQHEWLKTLTAAGDWRELERLAGLRPDMKVGRLRELFDPLRLALEGALGALGASYVVALAAVTDSLLVDLGSLYEARKRGLGALDFADLELRTLALLASGVRPYEGRSLLLVDEFQDTNALQCAILDGLGTTGRLTVGDDQQSIYGFRGADVEVFRQRRGEVEKGPEDAGAVVTLSTNFRSTPAVLEAINHLFRGPRLFGPRFAELQPPAEEPSGAAAGAATSASAGRDAPAVEIVVVDARGAEPADVADGASAARHQAEARVVAGRVVDLIACGRAPGDVAVLVRAFTHVARYEQELRGVGVPVYVVGGRGFYEREELADMLALLRVLINPYDDFSLAVVLRSPLGRFSDDLLYLAREEANLRGRRFLWEVLAEGAVPGAPATDVERLPAFVAGLSALRRRVGTPGLAGLLDDATSAFDYDLVLLAAPDGRRRYANLRKLMRLADDFESLEGPDLSAFVRYLETRKDLDASREGSAPVLAEQDDVVRIMTIHQAKGLEFPVVMVVGMGDSLRTDSERFLVGHAGDVAIRLKAPERMKHVRLELGPVDAIAAGREEQEYEEAVRLYYVAATRAKERLLLVGTPADPSAGGGDAPLGWALASFDLTAAAVLEHTTGEMLRPVDGLDLGVTPSAPTQPQPLHHAGEVRRPAPASPQAGLHPPLPLPAVERRSGLTRVSFSSLAEYAQCPRGFYVRRLLGLRLDDEAEEEAERSLVVDGPDEGRGPDGRRLGVAVHAALESLDLTREPTELELEAAVRRGQAAVAPAAVDADAVARLSRAFWHSPLVGLPDLATARSEAYFVFSRRGILVDGLLDVVGGEGEARWVIDYKTNRLAGRSPLEAVEPYRLQQQIYALAVLLAGAASVDVHFLFLEEPAEPVVYRATSADVERLECALDVALDGLERGSFPGRDDCGSCALLQICRVFGDDRGRTSGIGGEGGV